MLRLLSPHPFPRSLALAALLALGAAAHAADTARMIDQCRSRAAKSLGAAADSIAVKYEGQRTDGTHAVNGSASVGGRERTFQCSFNKAGTKIARFVVNKQAAGATAAEPKAEADRAADAQRRAGEGKFDARGPVACAMAPAQPMGQCDMGVARAGKASGTATVVITRPDGRTRAIFFEKFKAIGADLSQADGSMHFRAIRTDDLYKIEAGHERYEFPEAVLTGG